MFGEGFDAGRPEGCTGTAQIGACPRFTCPGLGARGVCVSLKGLAVGAFGLVPYTGIEKPFGAPPAVVVDMR